MRKEIPEEIYYQLESLGIEEKDIYGHVLDVGAGECEFASFFEDKNIISVDIDIPQDRKINFIKSDVRKMPFNNNFFDLVVSHASIPNMFIKMHDPNNEQKSKIKIKNAIKDSILEIKRVLKVGGKAILSPVRIAGNNIPEMVFKESVFETINDLNKKEVNIKFEYIESGQVFQNGDKYELYRLIITK